MRNPKKRTLDPPPSEKTDLSEGLHISLLGGFLIHQGEQTIGAEHFHLRNARDLIKLLALAPRHRLPRDQIMEWFWPDGDPKASTNSLNQTLRSARQVLGGFQPAVYIRNEDGILELVSDEALWVDVEAFEAAAAQARRSQEFSLYQAALELYTGELLPEDRYAEWAIMRREALQQTFLDLLMELARLHEGQGEHRLAITAYQRLLAIDRLVEAAHVGLMHSFALSGQRTQALRQYQILQEILDKELGAEPDLDTQRLYGQILEGKYPSSEKLAPPAEDLTQMLEVRKHNLPFQMTSFIGREQELAQVKDLLSSHRLVTLTGPGGTGKTRLALKVAESALQSFPDGVWLVTLAPLADPGLVVQTTARAFGMDLDTSSQALLFLQIFLESKHLLLILDNCEHLLESCAYLADALLKACPRLHILATSREALGIEGEAPAPVSPLRLPEASSSLPLAGLAQVESIRLFVERAGTISPEFQLTEENAPAIVQICRRLEGIPLALELAAARVKLLRVEDIAGRLDDRFRLLTGGSRIALPRYQTLRASIDWSYDLLLPAERTLLQRLSVFSGRWVLEAAESVGSGDGIEPGEILDLLGQLVNKSLVIAQAEAASDRRYQMLETIRQYAHEKLAESGESEWVRDQHLMYYVALAESVEDKIRGPDQRYLLSLLENELANIRLALEWSTSSSTSLTAERVRWLTEQGLRLAAALRWFWHCHGRWEEGSHWLISLLARQTDRGAIPVITDESVSPIQAGVRAKALYVAGDQISKLGDPNKAKQLFLESRDLYQVLGLQREKGYACLLIRLGFSIGDSQGNPNLAEQYLEESLAIFQKIGDRLWISECLSFLGRHFLTHHEYERARIYFEESLALSREIGDQEGTAFALTLLGEMILIWLPVAEPNLEAQACAFLEESRELFYQIGSSIISRPINQLATYSWRKGDYQKAEAYFKEVLPHGQKHGFTTGVASCLNALGMLYLSQGDDQKAAEKFNESLVISHKQDSQISIADSLFSIGLLAWEVGDFKRAGQNFAQALAIYQKTGNSFLVALLVLARISLKQNEYGKARTYLEQALELFQNEVYPRNKYSALEACALLAASWQEKASGIELEKPARLLGATQAWHLKWQLTRTPRERTEREESLADMRERLGEEVFEKAWEEGRAMTLEQAIPYAKTILND